MTVLIAYAATCALLALAHQLHSRRGLAIYLPMFRFTTTDANVFNDSSLDQDVPDGCDEKEVSRVTRLLTSSLNMTVDPCKDFHSYVCSGFKGIVQTSLLDDMETNVTTSISSFFHRITRGVKRSSLPEALKKAVEFYASCVKPVHTNGRTHALASFFKEQDFSFHTKIIGFLETTLELQLRLGLQIFFTLVMDPYPRFQETARYVYLRSSRIFEEWKRARKVLLRSGSYARYASAVILATGFDEKGTSDLIRRVWYVESKLMSRSIKPKSVLNGKKLVAKWKELLHQYSRGALMGTYQLSLQSRPSVFFHQMMFKANDAEQSLYLTWEVARHLVSASGFAELGSNSDRRAYCFDTTYAFYGPAISAALLFPFVNNSRLEQVRRMVRTLASEVYESIEDSDWVLPETKAKLATKLRLVTWKLGYDRNLGNWSGLSHYYENYPIASGIFLTDFVNTNAAHVLKFFELKRHLRELDFSFKSDVVGAFYEGPNVLVIPAASMLSPLFNYGASPAINYGFLGSVIMQNLMRAFGHNNMLTDGFGSPISWFPEERADFEDRYQCDRMSEVRDSEVDPLAGVSVGAQAFFRAYKRASAARGNRSCALPGLEVLTSDQVFFVSRCLLRCQDVQDTTDGIHMEDHTCNLMAKHSAEFANAFNCPIDHSNVLCDVW
ncbi:neprilysin-1 [Rhipicephalus microplus]|uniref:neprilysin-1 n=1 Tax=Rhipicephalus microplus TaxID=6941 RepID=UPI003F6D6F7A